MSIGTSTAASIPFVVEKLQQVRPTSILDIGCGWGRWGFLAREYLEFWDHRFKREDWKTHIVGVDINPGNWTPVQKYVYNRTVTKDLREFPPKLDEFDMIIATDVLEHLPKGDARRYLHWWYRSTPHVVVGVPWGEEWPSRGGFDDNPHEAHISTWRTTDFDGMPVVDSFVTVTEDPLPYALFHLAR